MPPRITLTLTKGPKQGEQFIFEERTTCIVGKGAECQPRFPKDDEHRTVSRHHCLLDINPPQVCIRDFGSKNGTYVNGEKIGGREREETAADAAKRQFPEHGLKHGDEVRLGKAKGTAFSVSIFVPTTCFNCAAEIPENQKTQAEIQPGVFECTVCRDNTVDAGVKTTASKMARICVKCFRDVSHEVEPNQQGEYTCAQCKATPKDIVRKLLEQAAGGARDLVAIRGYKIIKELGRGGMGAVYLAQHEQSGAEVALKVMLPRVAVNEKAKRAFLREIETTRVLRHPNVVQLLDFGCSEGTFYFTLEYCNAGSVDKLMKARGGVLKPDEAGPLILQALAGLEYAHSVEVPEVKLADGGMARAIGLVHRDIKPANIFLSMSGQGLTAKVGDYGLAKAFDLAGLSGMSMTGEAAGTPHFMPRQQVVNFRFAKPEVDVWAVAASLYSMLSGKAPRRFPQNEDMWQVVLQTDPAPIRERQPAIAPRLAEVIDQALRDKPEIGFKSAAQFRRALESVL